MTILNINCRNQNTYLQSALKKVPHSDETMRFDTHFFCCLVYFR